MLCLGGWKEKTEIKQLCSHKDPFLPHPSTAVEVQVITSIPHFEVGDRKYSPSIQPAVISSEFQTEIAYQKP